MATLKAISGRLKSVKNIRKITQSMKMVSAAKLSRVERELKQGVRPLGIGAKQFFTKAEIPEPKTDPKKIIIAISSDRGLCGGAHSGIAKNVRNELLAKGTDNTGIVCVGEKVRAILQYQFKKNFVLCAKEIGRKPPTYTDAAKLANAINTNEFKYNIGKIVFNKYKTIVSYGILHVAFFGVETVQAAPKFFSYDSVDDDILECYLEFTLSALLFYAMMESATSEQSARMTAMENATKNAGEMINKLSLQFNRGRQGTITRELTEIISGAAAIS